MALPEILVFLILAYLQTHSVKTVWVEQPEEPGIVGSASKCVINKLSPQRSPSDCQ